MTTSAISTPFVRHWTRKERALFSTCLILSISLLVISTLGILAQQSINMGPFNALAKLSFRATVTLAASSFSLLLTTLIFRQVFDQKRASEGRRAHIIEQLNTGALSDEQFSLFANEVLDDNGYDGKEAAEVSLLLTRSIRYFGAGLGIPDRFFDKSEIGSILSFLFKNGPFPLSCKLMKAALICVNQDFRDEFFQKLTAILEYLANNLPSKENEPLFEYSVSTLLSLIPYTCPHVDNEHQPRIQLPVKMNGQWKSVNYTLSKEFDLTPRILSSSPLPAYGFTSNDPEAPPIIIFSGTTYPQGKGALMSLLADSMPGMSIGRFPFLTAKKDVENWLPGKKLQAFGVSLGGSIALHFACSLPSLFESIHAVNPAGLYSWDLNRPFLDNPPTIFIYGHQSDFASSMGYFPENPANVPFERGKIHLIHVAAIGVIPNMLNFVKVHAQSYATFDRVLLYEVNSRNANRSYLRTFSTWTHIVVSPFVVFIPALIINVAKRIIELVLWCFSLPCHLMENCPQTLYASRRRPFIGRTTLQHVITQQRAHHKHS